MVLVAVMLVAALMVSVTPLKFGKLPPVSPQYRTWPVATRAVLSQRGADVRLHIA